MKNALNFRINMNDILKHIPSVVAMLDLWQEAAEPLFVGSYSRMYVSNSQPSFHFIRKLVEKNFKFRYQIIELFTFINFRFSVIKTTVIYTTILFKKSQVLT